MKPLSKKQLITLNIAITAAYKYQMGMGVIDHQTIDQWRHEQVMECVGCDGLRACNNSHYRKLVIHFERAQGKMVSWDRHILAGKPTREHAEEDTFQNRDTKRALIHKDLQAHAAEMARRGEPDRTITALYVESLARAKFQATQQQLAHLTVDQLRQLLITVRNRIAAREGRGNTKNRNKSQRARVKSAPAA